MPRKSKKVNKVDAKRQAGLQSLQEATILANACYKDAKFAKYSKKLAQDKELLVDEILRYRESDPVKYRAHIMEIVITYNSVAQLELNVNNDAKVKGA